MTGADALLVAGAGLVGGATNAIAGGGTLVTFPALLAAGLPSVAANVTSTFGLLPGYLGAAHGYRSGLTGQRHRLTVLLPAAVVGGVGGALLLLATSERLFRDLVPVLLGLAVVLLALQDRVAAMVARRRGAPTGREHLGVALVAVSLCAVYGGYFGAGMSVVLLALLGILVSDGLQRLNALRSALALAVNTAAAVVFLAGTHVRWGYAGLLAAGAVVGGSAGARVGRRLSAGQLRAVVCSGGLVAAVVLAVR